MSTVVIAPPPPPLPGNQSVLETGGDPECRPEPKQHPTRVLVVMNTINIVTHLCLGATALLAISFANFLKTQTGEFNSLTKHIILCVTGYVILMSQAVLSLNRFNGWSQALKNREKRVAHWVLQIIGSSLAIAGSIVRIVDVENKFSSAHGILGLVAMILTILSLLGGVANLLAMRCGMKIVFIRIGHACLGSLTLSVAFISLCFGFDNILYRFLFGEVNANLAIALTVFALVGTLLIAVLNTFTKLFCAK